jgi:hypothetical protein
MRLSDKDITPEFEKDAPDSVETNPQPALSNEQYVFMADINARIRDLKQGGFDLREYLDSVKQEVTRVETELEKARAELVNKTEEMQKCFEDFIFTPHGITGQIAIADTEPHYITIIEAPKA